MEARYLELLHGLSQRGLATRSRVEVEKMLATCKHCDYWTPDGCGMLTTREFAVLLADATKSCQEFSNREPNSVV